MSKIKYIVISSAIAAVLVATPLVISRCIDKKIEDNKVLLEKNGFKQEILSKSGYLSSVRTFNLEVVDALKARDFLLDSLVARNAQYKVFAQSIKMGTQSDIKEIFEGLKFRGEISNSNLIPISAKVNLTLDRLPYAAHTELTKNKELGDILLPMIAKGVLALDMTFGSDEKLKDVKFKDIKENIKIENSTLGLDMANQTLILSENDGIVNGIIGVGKQEMTLKSDNSFLKSHLENFKYNFNYKDDFNNKGYLELGKYEFELAEIYSNMKFALGTIKANSSVEDIKKDVNIKADYKLANIVFNNETEDVKIDSLLLKLFLRGINIDTMKKAQSDYNAMALGVGTPDDKAIIEDFVAFVNNGIKMDLGLGIQGMSGTLALKDVTADTTFEIAKNTYNDKQSPLEILNLIEISSKVKIHKDDQKTLEAFNIASPDELAYGIVEGDFFVYEIKMSKGAFTVNGKSL